MKKFSMIKNNAGEEMYQNPNEAKKHLHSQSQDFKRFANAILGFLPVNSGKLLDVGCGFGWVVAEASRRGFLAKGIDQARPYVALGKKTLHVDLLCTSLEDWKTNEKFNVVILNHVLEHIKNPKTFLTKIRSLLAPGGLLFVACPNIDSLMYWIFRDRWYGLQPAQHIWQFTGKSLPALIGKNGFAVDRIRVNSLDYRPGGWKRIVFFLLTSFANLVGWGDQVFVLAHKPNGQKK